MGRDKALVLGGGGVAGIAWTFGVLAGLADGPSGVDVRTPDVVIGTSAGSVVAAQLRPEVSLLERYEQQIKPRPAGAETELTPVGLDIQELWQQLTEARSGTGDPQEQRRRVGALALAAPTVDEAARRASVAARLALSTWPAGDVRITGVDARTGEDVVFTRESGVDLLDAVAASCAVPGVWPPVTIGDRRYVDGGVRTMVNADLATGFDRVLILAPLATPELDEEVAELARHSRVVLITADETAQTAFGANPLDPSTRTPAGLAGFAQGRENVETVRALWVG
ncbi:patatin-like phospholipase family protein [Kitasatospora sp. LaBMicrA B282]|uniref:patatin-like phospholipase family protein n=1 Tax=Kitasatospora sp. LaBMicrA B282 TaxID=3420949 RepID=UPI003D13EBA4